MVNQWIFCFMFLLLFQDIWLRCSCDILWTDLDNTCRSRFQSQISINVSHSVHENVPIGSVIYNSSSLNIEETSDFGSGRSYLMGNYNQMFNVENNTGAVVVNGLLDAETNRTEIVDIIIFDHDEGKITNVHLEINILDVDEPPTWTMPFQPYKAQITSDYNLNDVVYELSAVDPEHQTNPVVYGLFSDQYNLFQVNYITGEVTLKGRPSSDILAKDFLRITVTVTERDNTKNRNAADVVFYTFPQPPQFTSGGYTINVNEDDVDEAPAVLITVKARSFQSDDIVSYSIVRQPDGIGHTIDDNGTVTVTSKLDREYRVGYTLLIEALDSLDQATTAEVLVLINDVNDNNPEFSQNVYTYLDVREDYDITYPIGRVEISDPDADSNGTYYISSDTSLFRVNQDGSVYALDNLDYESHRQHRFQVTATDLRGRCSCAYVVISVKNIPDEKPVFSKPFYQFEVDRDASVGYNIGQVFAHDPDDNAIKFSIKSGTASQYFHLNQESGILSLASMAEELDPSCTMLVEAREINEVRQGLQSSSNTIGQVRITINTKDLNQHTPVFPHCNTYSSVEVEEETMIGTFVMNVTVEDIDRGQNGEIEFSLDNDGSQVFAIETMPGGVGIIRTRRSLDRELKSKHTITVIATDMADRYQLRSTCTLDVTVIDINDNKPSFDYSTYSRTLDRNVNVGTALLTIQAEDPDFGDTVLRYSLTNVVGDSYFALLSNGTMILRNRLQSLGTWKLEARATDSMGKFGTTQIVFEIVNNAHGLPTWSTYPFPEKTVSEDNSSIVFPVEATSIHSSYLTYEIVRGLTPETNSRRTFSINFRGEMLVDDNLDYEAVQTYRLKIRACDAAPAPNCAYMLVVVRVTDVNDNKPEFLIDDNLSANVVEGPVADDSILQLQARDSDITSLGVSYSTNCGRSDDSCYLFYTLHDTITTSVTEFDRELKSEYVMEVIAEDNTPPDWSDVKLLTINVLDINDNIPEFQDLSYSVVVSEDAMVGTVLISISATDADTDKVEHLILGGETTNNVDTMLYRHDTFHVDSATGSITLSSKLDFENIQRYQLTYAATDGVHQVTTSLIIQVADVNDKAPKFSRQRYETSVDEGTVYTEETPLFTVYATEYFDPFGSIVYSLYGVSDGTFFIDRLTGDVNITRKLDYEHKTEWRFLAIATDGDGDGVSSAADVSIRVDDVNDNSPEFLNPRYIGEIYEGSPVGSFVTRMSATDDDIGDYSNLLYSLSPSAPDEDDVPDGLNVADLFKIEPSGEVSTMDVFDREVHSTYFLEVIATDTDSNIAGSCTLTINILDNNDNLPTIAQDVFSAEISERVEVGRRVANLYAEDTDIGENAEVSFSIVGDEASSFWLDVNPVNKQTAIVRVKKDLDYQIKSVHNISIEVTQDAFKQRIGVVVSLQDVNDYVPKFSENSWNTSVMENTMIGTNILNISATDSDPGFNGVIRYAMSRSDKLKGIFAIHPVNGSIYLREELDRENRDHHVIQVIARDQGSPPSSTSTTVHIQVMDINDNSPLIRMEHEPVISESVTPPYQVVKIKAMDLDAPHNQGPFSFEMMCSDDQDVCDHFALIDQHDNTSVLQTKTHLDAKVKSKYTIRVRIKDSGEPPQSSINSLTVIIIPADSDSGIYVIIGSCAAVFIFLLLCSCCCVLCYKQRRRKSYDVAGYTQTYQSFTLGLRGGLLRVGGPSRSDVDNHRRKLARRSLSESDQVVNGQNTFGMELNSLCLSNDDKLTTLCEENENIDREYYRSDSSLDLVSSMSFSVETKTSKWVDASRARTLQSDVTDYGGHQPATFTFRTKHRVFTPTYV